jgi:glycosyltransferase involved in cell wall biosynthesis
VPDGVTTVGVNLLWLVPGVVGGSEEATVRTLTAIAERGPDDLRLVLFALDDFVSTYTDLAASFTTVPLRLSGRLKPLRVAAEHTWLPAQLRHARAEVVHHAGGTMPTRSGRPTVVTVHDLQPLDVPSNFPPVRVRYLRWALPRAARRAKVLVTPSAFVRNRMIELLDADPERVVVVPHGVEPCPSGPPADEIRRRYRLDGPFFVFPAITYPHKNHLVLLRAFASVAATDPEVALVLAGRPGPAEEAVSAEIERLGLGGRVRRPGRVPAGDLATLLGQAVALVFPSRYEGFGLPVVEAMAQACPVIAADRTALPEVVGGAGQLLDPDDEAGWAAAMVELLSDSAARGRWAAAARERARDFSWASTAMGVLDAYRRAAVSTGTA